MSPRVFQRLILFALIVLVSVPLAERTLLAALVIDSAAVSPASAPAGVATPVLVAATITDPSVVADGVNLQRLDASGRVIAVVGTLRDDGTNGDATAGDKIFSYRMTVFETSPGPVRLRVSAAFRGVLLRVFSSPLTVNVTGTATGITILSPADLAYLNTSPVNVNGTVGDPAAQVTVNGIPAAISGNSFQLTVPLVEGTNTLKAVAQNPSATTSTASVQVTLDTTPPHVTIESPADGLVTFDSTITVSGTVNDIVVGTVNSQQAVVTVNGLAAQVANRSFLGSGVPLVLGPNTIQVIGRDRSGNQATSQVSVTRRAPTQPFIRIGSGNNQSGPISSLLPAPLVVALEDGTGHPAANVPVVFQVTDNSGTVSPSGGAASPAVAVTTNAQGQAQVNFRLGSRSGAGANRVEASATGFEGVAAFTASGVPTGASLITVDSGNSQTGALGEKLAFPFVVVVTDAGFNRIGGVPVTFRVKTGGGTFGGQVNTTMNTDPDGRAAVFLTLGTEPGFDNNAVDASFSGNSGQPATFVASAKAPGNAADTRITGVVLDNSDQPIKGATLRLFKTNQGNANNTPIPVGTPVQTNELGVFLMQPVPVGFFKLMADGTTVAAEDGVFPTLEYDIVTVAGQENTLGMPIYLPQLDINHRLCVTETVGGTLTLPEIPGFSLTVAPGSATFPGGARNGCITVSSVNADKVPMAPGFGQQPRFIITIQPVGTMFNPPAPIVMPNVDGLKPGQVTELYSYDHDLAAFTAIGTGTVSEDGMLIRSDPGVGILKAGWHCGGDPASSGSAASLSVSAAPTDVTKGIGQAFSVTASGSPPLDAVYSWELISTAAGDDPSAISLTSSPSCANQPSCVASLTGSKPGRATLRVHFRCTTTGAEVTADVRITIYKVTIEKPTGDPATAGSADNEFTYTGSASPVATIPVRAKVEPPSAAADLGDKIRWSFVTTPTGSVLSWDATWPGDATKGRGVSTNGRLTGLPATNDQFGPRTIRMELVIDGSVATTETANLELFFERDTTVAGFTAPNWFRFWNQTGAGVAAGVYNSLTIAGNFGETPAMLDWSTYAGPRARIKIGDAVTGSDSRRDGSAQIITGIDLFANTVRHENRHVQQINENNTLPFFTGVTGVLRNAAGAGWSFNIAFGAAQWNHFTDRDGSNSFTAGDTDLDTDRDDLGNAFEVTAAQRAVCFSSGQDIECQAELSETSAEDTYLNVDWADPGKQHRTRSHID